MGSVRVVSEGPIAGMLRFDHPVIGVAGVGASLPVRDAIFPVRRQRGELAPRRRATIREKKRWW